jgi:hypothetical protein
MKLAAANQKPEPKCQRVISAKFARKKREKHKVAPDIIHNINKLSSFKNKRENQRETLREKRGRETRPLWPENVFRPSRN